MFGFVDDGTESCKGNITNLKSSNVAFSKCFMSQMPPDKTACILCVYTVGEGRVDGLLKQWDKTEHGYYEKFKDVFGSLWKCGRTL